jgi:HAD superfamily hydrolase (TIGR01509 family)
MRRRHKEVVNKAVAVIFDVDGTLVESVDIHARAWQDALHVFGHDVSFGEIRRQIGKGSDQLLPVFLGKDVLDAQGQEIDSHRGRILKERYLNRVTAFPRVRELFEALQQTGIQRILASSAKEDELEFYKRTAQIEDLIEKQTSSDDAEKSKPHPDIFEAALVRFGGKDANQVVVVGDTPYDAQAAGKLGLRTIGVTCGGWSSQELEHAGCTSVYRDPADLLDRLEEWTTIE